MGCYTLVCSDCSYDQLRNRSATAYFFWKVLSKTTY